MIGSRRNTLLAGVGAALVVLLLWYFLLWKPRQSKIADARDRRAAAEQQAANLRLTLARLQDLKRAEALKRSQIEALRVAVPDQPNLAQFIFDVNSAATKAGIDFLSITPSLPAAGTGANAPASVTVSMSLKGGYFQVLDFLNRLADLPRIVVVDSLSLSGGDETGSLGVSLGARMFVSSATPVAGGTTTTTTPPAATTTTAAGTTPTTAAATTTTGAP